VIGSGGGVTMEQLATILSMFLKILKHYENILPLGGVGSNDYRQEDSG